MNTHEESVAIAAAAPAQKDDDYWDQARRLEDLQQTVRDYLAARGTDRSAAELYAEQLSDLVHQV